MGKTTQTAWLLYVDHDVAVLVDELARETKRTRASLLREAVDDLLFTYGKRKVDDGAGCQSKTGGGG